MDVPEELRDFVLAALFYGAVVAVPLFISWIGEKASEKAERQRALYMKRRMDAYHAEARRTGHYDY